MDIGIGDVCKINGALCEVVAITPHQDIEGSVYYDLGDGYVERYVRFHPDAVYRRMDASKRAEIAVALGIYNTYSQTEDSLHIDFKSWCETRLKAKE